MKNGTECVEKILREFELKKSNIDYNPLTMKNTVEECFTIEEIRKALKGMKSNKLCGPGD